MCLCPVVSGRLFSRSHPPPLAPFPHRSSGFERRVSIKAPTSPSIYCAAVGRCLLPRASRRSSSVEGLPVNSSEVLVNSAQTPRSLRVLPIFIQLNLCVTTMVKEEEAVNAGSRLSWEE